HDTPQERRLAAPVRAEDDDELASVDVQVDAVQHLPLAEALADPAELEKAGRGGGRICRHPGGRAECRLRGQPMSLMLRCSALMTSRITWYMASVAGTIGPESTPSSVSTSLSWAGVSWNSAFLSAALKAGVSSPRTVIGSFGIADDRQMTRNFF